MPGALADPKLEIYSGSTKISENDNWLGNASVVSLGAQVGAFPLADTASKDAALYAPALAAGGYSAQLSGVGGTTGVALAEIYDATPAASFTTATRRLVNVSARTVAGTGADVLIAGFVIGGTTSKTVLIRAVGPTLTAFGVGGVLADPKLELYEDAAKKDENDNWGGTGALTAVFATVGAFALPAASKDAALLATLAPGAYTVQVSGVGAKTGVALVEIYEVQ